MVEALSIAVAAALASWTAAAPLRQVALQLGYVDVPGGRKVHAAATPLLGGVAIYGTVLALVLPYTFLRGYGLAVLSLVGAGVTFTAGLLDDWRGMRVKTKLAAQLVAAGIVVGAGLRLHLVQPPLADALLTAVFILLVTNGINLLDNMDGLAAGLTIAASGAFYLAAASAGDGELAVLAAAVAGASIGFLPHNFPRPRMFMGDAGALPLGFLLAVMSLMLARSATTERRFVPLIALALPIVDTALVVISRLRRGLNPLTTPGSDHVSHRLAGVLGTRQAAVVACWTLACLSAIVTIALFG